MNLRERAKELKKNSKIVYLALKHKNTPWYAKFLAGITIVYALSPIDLIPDFIPVLGYLDDVILLPALIALTIRCIPKSIVEECKREADNLWATGKPKKWYFAIPIILIWLLILLLIIYLIMK